jgi:hypothetical protein
VTPLGKAVTQIQRDLGVKDFIPKMTYSEVAGRKKEISTMKFPKYRIQDLLSMKA